MPRFSNKDRGADEMRAADALSNEIYGEKSEMHNNQADITNLNAKIQAAKDAIAAGKPLPNVSLVTLESQREALINENKGLAGEISQEQQQLAELRQKQVQEEAGIDGTAVLRAAGQFVGKVAAGIAVKKVAVEGAALAGEAQTAGTVSAGDKLAGAGVVSPEAAAANNQQPQKPRQPESLNPTGTQRIVFETAQDRLAAQQREVQAAADKFKVEAKQMAQTLQTTGSKVDAQQTVQGTAQVNNNIQQANLNQSASTVDPNTVKNTNEAVRSSKSVTDISTNALYTGQYNNQQQIQQAQQVSIAQEQLAAANQKFASTAASVGATISQGTTVPTNGQPVAVQTATNMKVVTMPDNRSRDEGVWAEAKDHRSLNNPNRTEFAAANARANIVSAREGHSMAPAVSQQQQMGGMAA